MADRYRLNSLRIGFWNCQRLGNVASDRTKHGQVRVAAWAKALQLDIIILAEITQLGEGFTEQLQNAENMGAPYLAQFIPVSNAWGDVSPCSFIVLSTQQCKCEPVGGSAHLKRPYLKITCEGRTFGAAHILAEQSAKSLEEIATILDDSGGGCLIGDMNYLFDDFQSAIQRKQIQGWQAASPGYLTYKDRKILDYIIYNSAVLQCQALDGPTMHEWSVIDHKPIAFELTWKR